VRGIARDEPCLSYILFYRRLVVAKSEDNWEWKETSFQKWRNVVNRRLKDIYVITIDDVGIDNDMLILHWEMKQSPYEFVEWFGNKYDLDPRSSFIFSL
jgi:hypothetical protein